MLVVFSTSGLSISIKVMHHFISGSAPSCATFICTTLFTVPNAPRPISLCFKNFDSRISDVFGMAPLHVYCAVRYVVDDQRVERIAHQPQPQTGQFAQPM